MILQGCHKSGKPGKILILAKIKENLEKLQKRFEKQNKSRKSDGNCCMD